LNTGYTASDSNVKYLTKNTINRTYSGWIQSWAPKNNNVGIFRSVIVRIPDGDTHKYKLIVYYRDESTPSGDYTQKSYDLDSCTIDWGQGFQGDTGKIYLEDFLRSKWGMKYRLACCMGRAELEEGLSGATPILPLSTICGPYSSKSTATVSTTTSCDCFMQRYCTNPENMSRPECSCFLPNRFREPSDKKDLYDYLQQNDPDSAIPECIFDDCRQHGYHRHAFTASDIDPCKPICAAITHIEATGNAVIDTKGISQSVQCSGGQGITTDGDKKKPDDPDNDDPNGDNSDDKSDDQESKIWGLDKNLVIGLGVGLGVLFLLAILVSINRRLSED